MNSSEKYDKIPEIWEGHNILDYIDPDIMKVSFPCFALHFSFLFIICLMSVTICRLKTMYHDNLLFFALSALLMGKDTIFG